MVDRLVSERFKHGNPKTPKIVIVASVGPDNVAEIPLLAEMADKHGADSMGVIPRHYRIEPGFSPLPHPDKTALEVWETVTLPALDKYIKSGFIDNSKGYLNLFKYYFMGKTLPFLCLAGFNSLTIDCYGDLFRCFPFAGEGINITTLASPPKTGEEAHLLLKKIWNSKEYGEERRIASKCRGCFWNCQTELTLLHHPLKTFF
jgi:radical SAM protein with 4Fe4S-binding SPASM domain